MRVISQNGYYDFNYENLSISLLGEKYNKLYAFIKPMQPIVLAEYSTEEKAKRALEMLHEEYRANQYALSIVSGTAIIKGLTPSEIENVKSLSANAKASCIFQFPSDENVEA